MEQRSVHITAPASHRRHRGPRRSALLQWIIGLRTRRELVCSPNGFRTLRVGGTGAADKACAAKSSNRFTCLRKRRPVFVALRGSMDKAEEAVLDSRVRSRSFNNSSSRKDGDCRCVCANKSYSLESIQPRRWRPCQLLREVFARTPLLFGRRSNDSSVPDRPSVIMTPAEESSITFSSEDSGHCESPSSLSASVVVFMDGQHLQPPKARRSCSADSAVDLDASPSAQQHRTSLPQGDRRRPLAQCLSLSCPALSAPSVVVSDYSGGESNGGESPELPDEASGCVSADDLRDYLSLGRSCSTCSLSSTISSISWDDEASHSDVSEASTCASPKVSRRLFT